MRCNKFEKYQLGKLAEDKFLNHKNRCAFCQQQQREDDQLVSRVRSEYKPIEARYLWERIEAGLKEEQRRSGEENKGFHFPSLIPIFSKPVFAGFAVFFLTAGLLLFFWLTTDKTMSSNLLDHKALIRVQQTEADYIQAIAALEQRVKPELTKLDLELMLLYKDRLETIDDQIEHCQEALAKNPASTHIRRYLLAALQDKKETLGEIAGRQKGLQKGT